MIIEGVSVRVLMGSAYGVTSPVINFSEILYIEAQLQSGQILSLPQATEAAIYVVEGKVSIQGKELQQYQMMTMDNSGKLTVSATQESRIVLIGGEPLSYDHFWCMAGEESGVTCW